MMNYLIQYIMAEANCTESRAEEIAYDIVDALDEMIHNRMEE